jgi:UDP-hydrolysing UDP-N-acetyl-D-glucosamine 2-epimerase
VKKKIKILFFSASRAEYNIQYPVLKIFNKLKIFKTYLVVSGSHTSLVLGNTKEFINSDKVNIACEIKIKLKSNNNIELVKYCIELKKKFLNIVLKFKPDYIFLTSDRFETLAIAELVHLLRIPIIHLEGGDNTEGGTLDDNIRHVITKLSHLHLTTNKDSYRRVNLLGETKKKIFQIGFPPLLEVKKNKLMNFSKIQELFKCKADQFIFIITLHPVPGETRLINNFFIFLDKLITNEKFFFIITYPNFDPGYLDIISKIKKIKNNKNVFLSKNLGRYNLYSLLRYIGEKKSGCCLGNSSSFIKETKIFKSPVILIGNRQKGRLMNDNIFKINNFSERSFGSVLNRVKKYKPSNKDYYYDNSEMKIKKFCNFLSKVSLNKIFNKKICY